MNKKGMVYKTTNSYGSEYKFVEDGREVVVYINGKEWGVPQGCRFIKALLMDIQNLKQDRLSNI